MAAIGETSMIANTVCEMTGLVNRTLGCDLTQPDLHYTLSGLTGPIDRSALVAPTAPATNATFLVEQHANNNNNNNNNTRTFMLLHGRGDDDTPVLPRTPGRVCAAVPLNLSTTLHNISTNMPTLYQSSAVPATSSSSVLAHQQQQQHPVKSSTAANVTLDLSSISVMEIAKLQTLSVGGIHLDAATSVQSVYETLKAEYAAHLAKLSVVRAKLREQHRLAKQALDESAESLAATSDENARRRATIAEQTERLAKLKLSAGANRQHVHTLATRPIPLEKSYAELRTIMQKNKNIDQFVPPLTSHLA